MTSTRTEFYKEHTQSIPISVTVIVTVKSYNETGSLK